MSQDTVPSGPQMRYFLGKLVWHMPDIAAVDDPNFDEILTDFLGEHMKKLLLRDLKGKTLSFGIEDGRLMVGKKIPSHEYRNPHERNGFVAKGFREDFMCEFDYEGELGKRDRDISHKVVLRNKNHDRTDNIWLVDPQNFSYLSSLAGDTAELKGRGTISFLADNRLIGFIRPEDSYMYEREVDIKKAA